MRILILTFYYQPDLSAGSFRATALVRSLVERTGQDTTIDVLTTLPNRYRSFTIEAPPREATGRATIRRFAVRHQGGMVDQSVAFLAFARQVRTELAAKRYDVVFATSSRLMTAVLGATAANRSGARLYLDIRDIFAENLPDVLPSPIGWLARPLISRLERYAVGRADRVNLVSEGFVDYFRRRFPGKQLSCLTNGIDTEFLTEPVVNRPSPRCDGPDTITLLYAGNIGAGQGLDRILPPLAQALGARARFIVIGDGGRRRALERVVADAGLPNVSVRPPLDRQSLVSAYRDADVLFLHLNDYPAFRRVLPSKIFDYAAMGKPILAGVAGYPADFIRKEVDNASVFTPGDVQGAVRGLAALALEDAPRDAFVAAYRRDRLSGRLADEVLSLGPKAARRE